MSVSLPSRLTVRSAFPSRAKQVAIGIGNQASKWVASVAAVETKQRYERGCHFLVPHSAFIGIVPTTSPVTLASDLQLPFLQSTPPQNWQGIHVAPDPS